MISGSDGDVEVVNPGNAEFSVPGHFALSQRWAISTFSSSDTAEATTLLFDRTTGESAELQTSPSCGEVAINGPYVMWHAPRDPPTTDDAISPEFCVTYVGRLK